MYKLNGALYFAKIDWLIQSKNFLSADTFGFVMPNERSVDIDTKADWEYAEKRLKSLDKQ